MPLIKAMSSEEAARIGEDPKADFAPSRPLASADPEEALASARRANASASGVQAPHEGRRVEAGSGAARPPRRSRCRSKRRTRPHARD